MRIPPNGFCAQSYKDTRRHAKELPGKHSPRSEATRIDTDDISSATQFIFAQIGRSANDTAIGYMMPLIFSVINNSTKPKAATDFLDLKTSVAKDEL